MRCSDPVAKHLPKVKFTRKSRKDRPARNVTNPARSLKIDRRERPTKFDYILPV